jgi:hypothetical protein
MFAVVFEYKEGVPGYAGVRTWTRYKSEQEFQDSYKEREEKESVIARDVSPQEAVDLCNETPLRARVAACIFEATNPDKTIDVDVLTIKLETCLRARMMLV